MFVSHDKHPKKKIQKPNILRKRSTAPVVRTSSIVETFESSHVKNVATSTSVHESGTQEVDIDKVTKRKSAKPVNNAKRSIYTFKLGSDSTQEYLIENVQDIEAKNCLPTTGHNSHANYNDEDQMEDSVNVESFLNSGLEKQNIEFYENNVPCLKDDGNNKWCFDFMNDPSQKKIIHKSDDYQEGSIYLEQKPDINAMIPLSVVTPVKQVLNSVHGDFFPLQYNISKITTEQLVKSPVEFKCDVPSCNKEFTSEQNLKKHKNLHNKDGSTRPPRPTTVECPVKKTIADGTDEPCGRIFHVREELMKHLNTDHSPEDALYRCEECGRRFFWASGVRAHARAHRGRARPPALACSWPGCSRVFRLPCRLREHTRAHTGDKPYPCRHPNCGWSFRTASKLVRHARRHTGERRHVCGACGRAFLRREHLRDHAQRHHSPHARRTHACTRPGCQQSFTNMSSLYLHMKKVHRKEENETTTITPEDNPITTNENESMFMVGLLHESPMSEVAAVVESQTAAEAEAETGAVVEVGAEAEAEAEAETHAARTHCTWPLAPRPPLYDQSSYVLEEDVHVEQSEEAESNIYTVRSDLFLHGNILNNEDSEGSGTVAEVSEEECAGATGAVGGVGGAEGAGGGGGAGDSESALVVLPVPALDADLLLDAPSLHLTQEELYTDAVDESSFRVFLLSGEELT